MAGLDPMGIRISGTYGKSSPHAYTDANGVEPGHDGKTVPAGHRRDGALSGRDIAGLYRQNANPPPLTPPQLTPPQLTPPPLAQ